MCGGRATTDELVKFWLLVRHPYLFWLPVQRRCIRLDVSAKLPAVLIIAPSLDVFKARIGCTEVLIKKMNLLNMVKNGQVCGAWDLITKQKKTLLNIFKINHQKILALICLVADVFKPALYSTINSECLWWNLENAFTFYKMIIAGIPDKIFQIIYSMYQDTRCRLKYFPINLWCKAMRCDSPIREVYRHF